MVSIYVSVYFTRPAQFIILSAGVFFFYLLYGYFQVMIILKLKLLPVRTQLDVLKG
jgi:hypothetical protein